MTADFFCLSKICMIADFLLPLHTIMNWKFILRWVITFTVCLVVYDLTESFWMSLGILILLIVAENLVVDMWKKRKEARA